MGKAKAKSSVRVIVMPALLVGLMALSHGCAHQDHALEERVRTLEVALGDVRRTERSIGVRIEDLENRLMVLRDELETRQTLLYRDRWSDSAAPELPTVRLQPEREREPHDHAPGSFGEPFVYHQLDGLGRLVSEGSAESEPDRAEAAVSRERRTPRAPQGASRREQQRAAREYREALELTKQGQYDEAMQRFERFIERYPTHTLADNAAYWYAECLYAQQMFLEAIQAFQRVIQDYPNGNKVPDAMLKTGLCYQNLNQMDQARRVLAQVKALYPHSPAAQVAKERAPLIR